MREIIDNSTKLLLTRWWRLHLGRVLFLIIGFSPMAYAEVGDVYHCADLKSFSISEEGQYDFEKLWFKFKWHEGRIEFKESTLSSTIDIEKTGVELFRSMESHSGSGAKVIMFNDGAYSEFTIFLDGTYFYRKAKCEKL